MPGSTSDRSAISVSARSSPSGCRARNLTLAGGYFAVPFSDPAQLPQELERLDQLLDTFDAAALVQTVARACRGRARRSPTRARRAAPHTRDGPSSDRSLGWDDAGWRQFADQLARIVDRCRERGYEPTFHPHTATYVEAPWEIERLLELSDVGVCLDTGHLLLGGGDPVSAVGDWGERINHLHLKDARLDVIRGHHQRLGAGRGDLAPARVLPARRRRRRARRRARGAARGWLRRLAGRRAGHPARRRGGRRDARQGSGCEPGMAAGARSVVPRRTRALGIPLARGGGA